MQTIRLSTTPGVVNPGAYLSQYDVGRQMLFLLYDDVGKYIPAAGSTVHIRATKPSGFGFDVACIWSQNSVTVTVTDEMSNESGSFGAELRIEKDGNILGTANFLWNVERSTHPEGTVDGNTEAKGLMQAIMAAITDAEEAAAAASQASAFSEDFKQALLDCFEHVAWIDENGQDYYDALEEALNPPIPATSITLDKSAINVHTLNVSEALAVNIQPPNTTDTIEWNSSDTSVATVTQTGVVDIIGWGSAVITATAGNVSATCTVTATNVTLSSIEAVFTQGGATIYTDDTLDSLKQYLVVTATYSDSSTEVLDDSDYTLSGTLTAGTSTITATYMTKTDTFNVTVTQAVQHYAIVNNLTHVASSNPVVTVEENDSFATALGVQTGYAMQSVTVTMGGVDITSSVYNSETRAISIAAVTGNVVITAVAVVMPSSIAAVFTQGSHEVLTTDSLDSLKPYLVVTATYSDSSTEVIAAENYTLSGTLTVGTSTITATYLGLTSSFSVTVDTAPLYSIPDFAEQTVSPNGGPMTVSKQNGIITVSGKGSGTAFIYPNGTVAITRATTAWFEVQQGDTMSNEMHDVDWNNPGATALVFESKFGRSDTDGNLYSASFDMAANGSGTGATGTPFSSQGLAYTRPLSCIAVQIKNTRSYSASISFRPKLYVNGVRYL